MIYLHSMLLVWGMYADYKYVGFVDRISIYNLQKYSIFSSLTLPNIWKILPLRYRLLSNISSLSFRNFGSSTFILPIETTISIALFIDYLFTIYFSTRHHYHLFFNKIVGKNGSDSWSFVVISWTFCVTVISSLIISLSLTPRYSYFSGTIR